MAPVGYIPVTFQQSITQVVENKEYAGTIAYGGTELGFTVKFPEDVQSIGRRPVKDAAEMRESCQIVLTKDDTALELDDEEYANFLILIAAFALDFAENGQTIATNRALSGMIETLKSFGARIEATMAITQTLLISPEGIEKLTRPKFGATLGTAL